MNASNLHLFVILWPIAPTQKDHFPVSATLVTQEMAMSIVQVRIKLNLLFVLSQNHPQRYEKLICFHSYTAATNEKFIARANDPARANEFIVGGSSVRMKTN